MVLPDSCSVASCLVYWGTRPPNVLTELICASERLRNIYIFQISRWLLHQHTYTINAVPKNQRAGGESEATRQTKCVCGGANNSPPHGTPVFIGGGGGGLMNLLFPRLQCKLRSRGFYNSCLVFPSIPFNVSLYVMFCLSDPFYQWTLYSTLETIIQWSVS